MNWLDVCGEPGSGKSTICDPIWGPHELPIQDELPPARWHDFINEITRLLIMIQPHPTIEAAWRMNNRSIRKIATVARTEASVPYVQTALVQRGLGFGWRLNHMGINLDELRHYFRLMPVSIGVVVTKCPEDVVVQRNHDREKVKATAHENRDFMVPLMKPAIEVAVDELRKRGVPVWEISTDQHPDESRRELQEYAAREPCDAEAGRPSNQSPALSAPAWWR